MLRIYPVILDWIAGLSPVIRAVARSDRGLADQLRRSSTSVVLNTAEGMGAVAGNKTRAYRAALKEMRESLAALDVAERLEYIDAVDETAVARQQHITATLVKLARVRP